MNRGQTGRGSSSSSGILLRAALDSSPVPCTKADIYAGMALAEEAKVSKKPAASKGTCKKPAAKPGKTVSLSMDMKFEPGSLSLMTKLFQSDPVTLETYWMIARSTVGGS